MLWEFLRQKSPNLFLLRSLHAEHLYPNLFTFVSWHPNLADTMKGSTLRRKLYGDRKNASEDRGFPNLADTTEGITLRRNLHINTNDASEDRGFPPWKTSVPRRVPLSRIDFDKKGMYV